MASATAPTPAATFAVDFATLAREIAMDIFPVDQILRLHQMTNAEWMEIQSNPKFIEMLHQMTVDWNSAKGTKERVKIKAQTGLEAMLEEYISAIADTTIPLNHRVEAGKFMARLGEMDGAQSIVGGGGGGGVRITINVTPDQPPLVIDATPVLQEETEDA